MSSVGLGVGPHTYPKGMVTKYRDMLQDIINCFWDMSPLEFARTKGLDHISDAYGEELLEKARALLKEPIG